MLELILFNFSITILMKDSANINRDPRIQNSPNIKNYPGCLILGGVSIREQRSIDLPLEHRILVDGVKVQSLTPTIGTTFGAQI